MTYVKTSGRAAVLALAGAALTVAWAEPALADSPEAPQQAASADQNGPVDLSAVSVTAQRRSEGIQQVPVAVTAISGDTLKNNGQTIINDITSAVPNFNGQSTEGRERPRWFLRGVGSNDPSTASLSPVGVYYDDVYINSVYAQGMPLFDLQQVEVLRGPQGTLWGKNTIGGAINLLSVKPSFRHDAYATLGAGDYNSRIAELATGGALYGDTVAGRISLYHENSDSWITNDYNGQRWGGMDDSAVRGQLLFETSEDTDLLLSGHYRRYTGGADPWHSNSALPTGADSNGFVASPDPYQVDLNAPSSDRISNDGLSATGHWYIKNGLTLTSITAFEDVDRHYQDDEDFSPNEFSRSYSYVDARQLSQEFRLTSPRQDRLNWIAGAHLFYETQRSDSATGGLGSQATLGPGDTSGPANYQDAQFTQRTASYALFGSSTYRFTDRLNLTAGLRYTLERKGIDLESVTAPAGTFTFNDPLTWWARNSLSIAPTPNAEQHTSNVWSAPTWDLTPEYLISDNTRVYFRYARGFRSGGYNGGANSQATVNTVAPERLTDYEGGFKSEWFNKRLIANISVFHYNYKNIQVFALAPSPTGGTPVPTLSNAGTGEVDGGELELKVEPIQHLYLFTNVGLLDARYTNFAFVPTAVGNSFARSPHTTVNGGGEYRLPVGTGTVAFGGDANYQGHQFFSATRQADPNLAQAGYTLINLHLGYHSAGDKYVLNAWVHNVADRVYKKLELVPSFGAYPTLYGDPRLFGVSLTVKL